MSKMGSREYTVRLNSSPELVDALNDLPIKSVNGAMVYIRDVAQVRDGFAVQSNIVNQDGRRSAALSHSVEERWRFDPGYCQSCQRGNTPD